MRVRCEGSERAFSISSETNANLVVFFSFHQNRLVFKILQLRCHAPVPAPIFLFPPPPLHPTSTLPNNTTPTPTPSSTHHPHPLHSPPLHPPFAYPQSAFLKIKFEAVPLAGSCVDKCVGGISRVRNQSFAILYNSLASSHVPQANINPASLLSRPSPPAPPGVLTTITNQYLTR